MRIFDAHMHMGHWGSHTILGKKIAPFRDREMDTPIKVLRHLDCKLIEKAVVVPLYSPIPEEAYMINNLVLETFKNAPDRIIPGLWVNPSPKLEEQLSATLQVARENGIHVLKTSAQAWGQQYSPDPASWDKPFKSSMAIILEYLEDTGSVLQLHTGSKQSDIRVIEKLIRFANPRIHFHLVHMGNNASGHFYLIPRLGKWLKEGFRITCDTSWAKGFAVRWILNLALDDPVLSAAIMFGSDEPWGVFQAEIAKVIDSAGENSDLLHAVLWSNAFRVYSI